MLKRKSTSRALPTLAARCSQLINAKNFHTREHGYYLFLFNHSFQSEPDFTRPLEYTPLQQFWQLQAERHQAELFRIEKELYQLEIITAAA